MTRHTNEHAVKELCAMLGNDPMWVQGAGGNVSWKDGETLWIKASGTWLKDSLSQNIFVPVHLADLRSLLQAGRFDAAPVTLGSSSLRPSIETALHALMPQKIVVHVHSIDALAWLVRQDHETEIRDRLPTSISAAFAPYCKPGAELARAVANSLHTVPDANIVFLANHGVVIAGNHVDEISELLSSIHQTLAIEIKQPEYKAQHAPISIGDERLTAIEDPLLQQLVLDTQHHHRLKGCWALYPDHVVFLGASPTLLRDRTELSLLRKIDPSWRKQAVFIMGEGVYQAQEMTAGQLAQLNCYAQVILRQSADTPLRTLSFEQIAALLNWDAEKYRQQLNQ